MRIVIYEKGHRDANFYRYIGPLALSRGVTQEMHDKQYGPLYDEPYAIWFVAFDDHSEFLGCCTLFDKEKEIFLDNCYVLPKHRGKGIGQQLFAERLRRARDLQGHRKIRGITMNEAQAHIYQKFGFRVASKRGKYYWMELAPKETK